jgi:hypothetical protein
MIVGLDRERRRISSIRSDYGELRRKSHVQCGEDVNAGAVVEYGETRTIFVDTTQSIISDLTLTVTAVLV